MKPYEHEGQLHVPHRTHPLKTRIVMWGVGIACLALAGIGWAVGVKTTVREGVSGVAATASGTGDALSELRARSQTSTRTAVDTTTEQMKDSVAPYLDAAEERMQALDLVTGMVKENLEASTEGGVSTSPKEATKSKESPSAKAIPPDTSEPTE